MKLTAKIDETHLLNERLKEKVKNATLEFEKFKEKTTKQLIFMESENILLKKEASEQSDRYYDEKQKWQSELRAAESEIMKLNRRGRL